MAASSQPQRSSSEVRKTSRSAARSLWRTHREGSGFLTKNLWAWLTHYLGLVLRPRRPFPTYAATGRPGVFALPNECRLGLAGDWGTGTETAEKVARNMGGHEPQVTIHLGDVYYSGTTPEFTDYFLPTWPRGALRTFLLNGNHEMYSGGEGYFGTALPRVKQETSYFCLENDHWRIIGLDTGYYARVFPLLELLLSGWIRLHDATREWLASVVFADPADKRPVILLSHHQWFSSFDTEYRHLGKDLAAYLPRVLLWFWGHEHRFAAYGPHGLDGYPKVRARCIGHGGMPVELKGLPKRDRNLLLYDNRQAGTVDGDPIGYCGYALLNLKGPELRVEYRDERDFLLFAEEWTQSSGGISGRVAHLEGVTLEKPEPIQL